jgi:type IV secretory pathway VirB10-like protein
MRLTFSLLAALWWTLGSSQLALAQPTTNAQVPAQPDKTPGTADGPTVPAAPRVALEASPPAPLPAPTEEVGPGSPLPGAASAADDAEAPVDPVQSASAEQTELRARIVAIEHAEPLDNSVRRPIDFAKAALERSLASRAVNDQSSEQRTRQLARAAVELAEARLRLLRERALFLAAQTRRNVSTAELTTAQRALEHDRARARELERASAVP